MSNIIVIAFSDDGNPKKKRRKKANGIGGVSNIIGKKSPEFRRFVANIIVNTQSIANPKDKQCSKVKLYCIYEQLQGNCSKFEHGLSMVFTKFLDLTYRRFPDDLRTVYQVCFSKHPNKLTLAAEAKNILIF